MLVSQLMAGMLIVATTGLCPSTGVAFGASKVSSQDIQLPQLPANPQGQIPQAAKPQTRTLKIKTVTPLSRAGQASDENAVESVGQSAEVGFGASPTQAQAAARQMTMPNASNQRQSSDPLAPLNHEMLNLNAKVDDKAFHPVASAWARVVPEPARQCIHRVFDNVAFLPRLTNAAFQLKLKDAGGELARFGINTTVGVGGLFDPAGKWFGITEHDNDFDKTLAAWGMSGGWFVVMPVAGPVNLRNALGHFVDSALDPMNYLVPGSAEIYGAFAHSLDGLNERAEDLDKFEGVPLHTDTFHPVALDSPDLYDKVRANFLQKENQKERRSAAVVAAATARATVAGAAAGGTSRAGAAAVGKAAREAAKIGQ